MRTARAMEMGMAFIGYGSLELPPPNLLDWPIHFAFRRGGKIMEWGTNELCTRTKLTRVDLLFRMLKAQQRYRVPGLLSTLTGCCHRDEQAT
ncbi:hypothetical protein PINS_up023011 [Pythium insidiosum]|nr:hypothetical protein PINS_up023011 [Pythium insidiosum]